MALSDTSHFRTKLSEQTYYFGENKKQQQLHRIKMRSK